MNSIKLCNQSNPIKMSSFLCEFSHALSEQQIITIINAHKEKKELLTDFSHMQEMNSINVMIGQDGEQKVGSQKMGGVKFDRLDENGKINWSVVINQTSLVVSCFNYTRWSKIWQEVQEIYTQIKDLLKGMNVVTLGIEYHDEFIILKPETNEWMSELLNKESKYLNKNIFEINQFWHIDHGYFIEEKEPFNIKILNSINIAYFTENNIENTAEHKLLIRTQHKSILDEPTSIESIFKEENINLKMDSDHNLNKNILLDILNEKISKEIDLKG